MIFTIAQSIFTLLLFMGAGYLLCRCGVLPASSAGILSRVVLWVFLPLLNFKSFAARFTPDNLRENAVPLLCGCCFVLVIYLCARLLSRGLTRDRYERRVYTYTLTMPNFAYIGYTLMAMLFGEVMQVKMIVFCLPFSIWCNSEGYRLLTDGGKPSLRSFLSPPTVAVLLGMAVGLCSPWFTLPDFLMDAAARGAACVSPCAMLLTGIALTEYRLRDMLCRPMNYVMCLLRGIAIPVLGTLALLGVTRLLPIDPVMARECLTISALALAMPVGLNNIIFPRSCGKDCRSGAGMVLISNLLILVTVPLVLWIFSGVILPLA